LHELQIWIRKLCEEEEEVVVESRTPCSDIVDIASFYPLSRLST
jgi:hypothetical protein